MITVILFSFLAVVVGFVLWTSNANRRAGQNPAGNRKKPSPR